MSVTLVTRPDPFALTLGGRMLFEFSGAGRFQTQGVQASAQLFCAYPVPSGTKLRLDWGSLSHDLLFLDSPVGPDEFTAGDGSADYVDALLVELQGYYPIRQNFILTRNDPTQLPGIIFTARKPGPQYDITVNLPVGTPFGFGSTTFGAEPLVRSQYSVYVELYLQKVGTTGDDLDADYELIFDTPVACDEQGTARFDVGSLLHARLKADWPSWSLPAPLLNQHSQRKYYIAYGEAFDSPLKIGRITTDPVRWAYLGGADYLAKADGGFDFLGLRNNTASDDAALRFGPLLRYVRPDEPQFLTFLNSRDAQEGVLLKIVRTFDNDGTDTRIENLSAQDFGSGHKITYCVGPTQQDLINTLPNGRSLKEYSVQLISATSAPLSVVYRFILNYDYQPYTRYFVFLSSLGVPETVTTFGKGSWELKRFSEQAKRFLPSNYQLIDGQFVDFNIDTQRGFEVATGFRSQAELAGWDDFYRSPERFHLVDGKALPMGITSQSIKLAKDGDTLRAHLFQAVYLFRDAFYTADRGEVGNTLPPLNFAPAGSITIEQPQVINAVDSTISNAVRGLTAGILNTYNQAVAWGNHALAGYLTQASGSLLFRKLSDKISWVGELKDKPTTRDGYGLTDVPTKTEVADSKVAGLRQAAPEQDDSVQQADSLIVYQTVTGEGGAEYRESAPMTFSRAADFILENATAEQLEALLARMKPTLDRTLANGNESDRDQVVRESNRRSLTILNSLDMIGGRVYDPARKLHLERYISPQAMALLLQSLFDLPTLAAELAPYLGVEAAAPPASAWIIDDDPVTCEDRWKEFGRDDLNNTDFQ